MTQDDAASDPCDNTHRQTHRCLGSQAGVPQTAHRPRRLKTVPSTWSRRESAPSIAVRAHRKRHHLPKFQTLCHGADQSDRRHAPSMSGLGRWCFGFHSTTILAPTPLRMCRHKTVYSAHQPAHRGSGCTTTYHPHHWRRQIRALATPVHHAGGVAHTCRPRQRQ